MNATAVTGMNLRSPPIVRMSWLSCDAVDHRAGAEEERALVEGVRDHHEDRGLVRADADGEEHVAELADRRVRQHPFDVVLHERDVPASSAVIAPTHATTVDRVAARLEERVRAARGGTRRR